MLLPKNFEVDSFAKVFCDLASKAKKQVQNLKFQKKEKSLWKNILWIILQINI